MQRLRSLLGGAHSIAGGKHSCRQRSNVAQVPENNRVLQISEEVRDAVLSGKPVVALETTIYTHGWPYPSNIELSKELETLVRQNGAVPATIGVLEGVARVGFSDYELERLLENRGARKISRRDLALVTGSRFTGRNLSGGTTISGTMVLAHLAGIKVFATGGLGGVHQGGETSLDISADLTEFGRTPVAVISSGCKGFLDLPRTLEYLETEGAAVATFADGREGKVDFPAFWSRDSGTESPAIVKDEAEAAAMIHASRLLPLSSGMLFANPVPVAHDIPQTEMASLIERAVQEGIQAGATGSANTPYVLDALKRLTGGKSLTTNHALVTSNVVRGSRVAVELQKLEASTDSTSSTL